MEITDRDLGWMSVIFVIIALMYAIMQTRCGVLT
jgi:hypothetical protein